MASTSPADRPRADLCRRLMGAWMGQVARRRGLVVLGALLLTALALLACARGLGISTNTVDMIDPDTPFRQHAKTFNAAFPQLDNTIVAVIDGPTPEAADLAADRLAGWLRGHDTIRGVYAPGTGFLKTHGLLFLPPDALASLVDRLAAAEPLLATLARQPHLGGLAELLSQAAEAEDAPVTDGFARLLDEMAVSARALAAGEPRGLSWQALMTPATGDAAGAALTSSTRRFVVLEPTLDFSRLKPAQAAIAAVEEAAGAIAAEAGTRIRLTGEAVIEHEEMESVEAGGLLAGALSLLAVALILGAGFRGPRAVAACLITLVAGLVWTAGLAAVLVGDLNLISVAFAVLFVGLGIDFCIHFALRYREAPAADREAGLIRAGQGVGCALLLSALCAAVGFLSFLPTAYRGLAELGLIAGVGMAVAVIASLTLLPALMSLFGARPRVRVEAAPAPAGPPWLIRWRRPVLAGAAVLAVAGALLAPSVRFDFNPMNLRDQQAPSMQAFADLTQDTRTTPYVVNVLADDLDAARALAERFRAAPAFGGARTLASFVPDNQAEKLAILGDAAFFLAPLLTGPVPADGARSPNPDAAHADIRAALDTLAERDGVVGTAAGEARAALEALGSAPDLAALNARWTGYLPRTLRFLRAALSVEDVGRADLPAALQARWVTDDGRARVRARPADPIASNAEIQRFARAALEVTPRATGAPVTIQKASEAVIGAFVAATGYAAAAILAILALTLRRARDVLLALAPLVLAATLTLATAGAAGIPLNFANVIVLPLLLGLGVSSGIHLVLRARQAGGAAAALRSSTPRAVLLSVLTTLASFGTLMVSAHKGMSSMGTLLTIAIAWTLLSVLVVLPALLAALERPRRWAPDDG